MIAAGKTRRSLPWVLLGLAAAVVVLLGASLVHVEAPPTGTFPKNPPAGVGMLLADLATDEEDMALRGELELKDPTPLFLPTEWNSGQVDSSMTVERAPGASFGAFGEKWLFPAAANDLDLPDVVQVPGDVMVALNGLSGAVEAHELTRRDTRGAGLGERGGLLQVLSLESGRVLHEQELAADEAGTSLAVPVEALLAINSNGLWLPPTVLESMEGVSVDLNQVDLLLREARLESVLSPGFYRILLGPSNLTAVEKLQLTVFFALFTFSTLFSSFGEGS